MTGKPDRRELKLDLESLFEAARKGGGPTPEQSARVRWGVQRKLSAGLGLSGAAGIAAWSGSAKAALAVVAVAMAGSAGYVWSGAEQRTEPVTLASGADPSGGPSGGKAEQERRGETPAEESESKRLDDEPSRRAVVESVQGEDPVFSPEYDSKPTNRPSQVIQPHAKAKAPRPEIPSELTSRPAENLETEVRTLSAARRALREGDAEGAARFLRAYDRKVKKGALAEERAATEILVLCSRGESSRARALASEFRAKWPRSPLAGRVHSSCAGSPLAKGGQQE